MQTIGTSPKSWPHLYPQTSPAAATHRKSFGGGSPLLKSLKQGRLQERYHDRAGSVTVTSRSSVKACDDVRYHLAEVMQQCNVTEKVPPAAFESAFCAGVLLHNPPPKKKHGDFPLRFAGVNIP